MHRRCQGTRVALALLSAAVVSFVLAACGSSGDANKLLQETFSGSHKVTSGNLNLGFLIDPSGSSSLKGPISLNFGGPFQSLGPGKLPQSDFNINVQALGRSGSLGILSTGSNGYVTLQGDAYQLPAATFQRLESSFSSLASSPNSSSGSGALNKLGIQPLHWLVNPTVVGDETVAGAKTTHIHAGINVPALLNDLNTFLERASSIGVSGANRFQSGLSPSTRSRVAQAITNPSFDVWTGKSDKTVRKLAIKMTVAVTGQFSTLLGGLRSAIVGLNMQYANLNEPQTISAPTSVKPFNEFASKVKAFFASLQTLLGSSGLGGNGGTGSAGTGTNGSAGTGTTGSAGTGTTGSAGTSGAGSSGTSGSSSSLQRYSQCIQAAGNDVSKMQACAPLLNGGG